MSIPFNSYPQSPRSEYQLSPLDISAVHRDKTNSAQQEKPFSKTYVSNPVHCIGKEGPHPEGIPTAGGIESSSSPTYSERKALRRLLDSWMERLQLISVLTIFFASTEATLLSITTPPQGQEKSITILASAANAGLTGGLVLHILAASISFLGGFFLVRYKIKWAYKEQRSITNKRMIDNGHHTCPVHTFVASPVNVGPAITLPNPEGAVRSPISSCTWLRGTIISAYPSTLIATHSDTYSMNKSDEGPSRVPTRLLGYFYYICVVLTILGFLFSVIGLICDAYDRLPPVIGTVSLTVISISVLAVGMVFLVSEDIKGDRKEVVTERNIEEGNARLYPVVS